MFKLFKGRTQTRALSPRPPAPTPADRGLPDRPSLEGYTIQELRTEQVADFLTDLERHRGT
jgi:hypothetical protein